ncbi:actin-related protein 10 [Microdochium nivale]|nr:actin-related protein 10 [Microdochium nivale]
MSSSAGAPLPHRTLSSIRGGTSAPAVSGPHTPTRPPPAATFSSPSSLRADEDIVVIELGARNLRVGWAGDPAPKKKVYFTPKHQRRAGDFSAYDPKHGNQWRSRASGRDWAAGHELWQLDVRGQSLALVRDKLERELRDTMTRYLLTDSKQRRMSLVLPPTLPIPLLGCVLDTIFERFQAPTVSLLSAPVMAALAAGTRSALVIDIGWHETTVTAVYEYREVQTTRSDRAGKMLIHEVYRFLSKILRDQFGDSATHGDHDNYDVVSFEECEDFARRALWCRRDTRDLFHDADAASRDEFHDAEDGLAAVQEEDEQRSVADAGDDTRPITVSLRSTQPPRTLQIPFFELAEPCESTFFETELSPSSFDDNELPIQRLVYQSLLRLPLDVRAACMSRIIFAGGCANIIGLRGRIFDDVAALAQEHSWDPVRGKGVEQFRINPKLHRTAPPPSYTGSIPIVVPQPPTTTTTTSPDPSSGSAPAGEEASTPAAAAAPSNPAHISSGPDQVEEMIRRDKNYKPATQGTLRAIETLGAWCGASMAAQLKVPAIAVVDRELWAQHGAAGAVRAADVDAKVSAAAVTQQQQHHHHHNQRQGLAPGAMLRAGQGAGASAWTLGVWGST